MLSLTLEAVGDANVACETAMDMAYHTQSSRRPYGVGAETSGTGSLKGKTCPQPGVGQNSRSGVGQEIVPNLDVIHRGQVRTHNGNKRASVTSPQTKKSEWGCPFCASVTSPGTEKGEWNCTFPVISDPARAWTVLEAHMRHHDRHDKVLG